MERTIMLQAHAASQQVGSSALAWLGSLICGTFVLLIFLFVVLPAVWARNDELRKAAFQVLDRILRALTGR
jgi:hypothetical protein